MPLMSHPTAVPEALLNILAEPGTHDDLSVQSEALVADKSAKRYPVVAGIPVFIETDQLDDDKAVLHRFYQEYGWQKNDRGQYKTRLAFGFGSPTLQEHRRQINREQARYFPPSGDYFLDCASGAVAVDEYLEYSRGYRYHVCVDLTLSALRGARERLGDHGLYVNGDATCLPFKSNTFSAALCSHTLYHVPETQQATVLEEFHRVLAPGGVCAVFYNVGKHSAVGKLIRPYLELRNRRRRKRYDDSPEIYSYHYPAAWFDAFRSLFSSVELHPYQFLPNQVMKYFFPDGAVTNSLGAAFSPLVRKAERNDKLVAQSQYVTAVLRK